MAATLTRDGELTHFSFAIDATKTETDADGNVIVYGKASDGSVDSDEQIIDPDFAAKAIRDWLEDGANVRVQHNPQRDPAGVGIDMDTDEHGGTWVKSKILEPIAQKLVLGGALRAYSVGIARPEIVRDVRARGGLIKGGKVVEISLVDRPANKNCAIQLVKAASDGHAELSGEILGDSDFIQKMIGNDILTKGAGVTATAEKMVTIELPEDVSVAFTPADLARIVSKKAKDPNVGEDIVPGGVRREEMPESDFAGRNRSFPIHSPGDVSDAAQSIGRAGPDNYSADQLKRNIKRIARRKGPAYEAQLPEAWKAEDAREYLIVKHGWLPAQLNEFSDNALMDLFHATKAAEADLMKGACTLCHGTGKIREGNVTCPRCHGSGKASSAVSEDDDNDSAEKRSDDPEIVKRKVDDYQPQPYDSGGEGAGEPVTCPNCGKGDAADAKYCDQCGFELQGADGVIVKRKKAAESVVDDDEDNDHDDDDDGDGAVAHYDDDDDDDDEKSEKAMRAGKRCKTCGGDGRILGNNRKCPDCGGTGMRVKKSFAAQVLKGQGMACKGCGGAMKAKHKFCPHCGAAAGAVGEMPDKTGVTKGEVPTHGVTGHGSEPVPEHREPDGATVEAWEDDAGMQDGDNEPPTRLEEPTLKGDAGVLALHRVMKAGAPASLGVLHDLTCAAFSTAAIAKCYPERTVADTVDVQEWQVKSLDLAASLPFPAAAHAARLGQHAMTLKSSTPAEVLEARDELHKAFSDANPGPGTAPTPATISPGRFNRPYISDGHAAPSPAYSSPNQTPVTSGEITAAQFGRGPLTTGHAAPSPGNSPVTSAVGKALEGAVMASNAAVSKGRTFYSNQGKNATRDAMKAIHDHISHTFPDLCPMHGEVPASKPDAAPASVKMPTPPSQLLKAENRMSEAEFAQATLPDTWPAVTKAERVSVAADGITELVGEIAELQKLVKDQKKLLKKQAKAISDLESQPDPAVTAYRGVALDAPQVINKSASPAVPGMSMADVAERTKAMMLTELENEFRNSPEPALREAAWKSILRLRGVG